MDDITEQLQGLTRRLRAYRIIRHIVEGEVSLDRLNGKLDKAAGVLGRVYTKAEARADGIIEREAKIESRIHEVFTPHEQMLTATEKGLDRVEDKLKLLANIDPLAGTPESKPETQPSVYKS